MGAHRQLKRAPSLLVGAIAVMLGLAVASCSSPTGAVFRTGTASPRDSASTDTAPATKATVATAPVPAAYHSLYSTIQSQLDQAEQVVRRLPTVQSASTMLFGSVLLLADGNRGRQLLLPQTMTEVNQELAILARMGDRGVTIQVCFPLLLPSTPDSAKYLQFYEQVARAIRSRHLLLSIEENPVLVGSRFSGSADVSFAGLTDATYAVEQAQMAQTIIDTLHPTYLTLMSEPDTYATYLGLPALDVPATSAAIVKGEVAHIRRDSTQLGAGAGTWSSTAFDRAYASTGVNYLDMHVYATEPAFVANAVTDAAEARAAHLPLVMDEFYVYPALTAGMGGTVLKHEIEVFTWMDPLEIQFLQVFTDFARKEGLRYIDAFDDNTFVATIPWAPSDDTNSLLSVDSLYDPVLRTALAAGDMSPVGQAYSELIRAPG